jgi:hypothetical protein
VALHEVVLTRDVPLRNQAPREMAGHRGAFRRHGKARSGPVEGDQTSPLCFEALVSGQAGSVAELAATEGISDRYVSSLLPLAFLAPDIVEAIASGRQPPELTAHRLIRTVDLPIAWAAQKQLLGIG